MSKIKTVHFNALVPIGAEATPEQRIHNGVAHNGGVWGIDVDFDDDPRFLIVRLTNRDTKGVFEQLVSLGSVASILMEEKREPNKGPQPAKK